MRSTRHTVKFLRRFILKGLDGALPPGSYEITTDEEQIPGMTFIGWHRVKTTIQIPAIEVNAGFEQHITINPGDLAEALARDSRPLPM
jgi:hypothetical protein